MASRPAPGPHWERKPGGLVRERQEFPVHDGIRTRISDVFSRTPLAVGLPSGAPQQTASSAIPIPVMTQPSPAGSRDRRCGTQLLALRRSDDCDPHRLLREEPVATSGGERMPDQAAVTGRVTSGAAQGPASETPAGDGAIAPPAGADLPVSHLVACCSEPGGRSGRNNAVTDGGSTGSRTVLPARSPLATGSVRA